MRFAGVVTRSIGTLALAAMVSIPAAAQGKPAPTKPTTPPAAAAPTGPAPTKVAFVNARKVLQSTPGWSAAEQTFTKESDGYRVELQKLQATLDSAASDFEQQSVVLSPTQRQAKRTELDQKRQALEQKAQDLQQKAQQRETELLAPLQAKVNTVIEAMRAEGNYAMIFDVSAQGGNIVAADRSLDLTDKVIEKLKATN